MCFRITFISLVYVRFLETKFVQGSIAMHVGVPSN